MKRLSLASLFTVALVACGGGSSGNRMRPAGSYASCVPMASAGAATSTCFAFPLTSGQTADDVCAADTENAETWVSVASCPSSNLIGCCGLNDTWQCFYAGTESDLESGCTGDGNTWIKTAP